MSGVDVWFCYLNLASEENQSLFSDTNKLKALHNNEQLNMESDDALKLIWFCDIGPGVMIGLYRLPHIRTDLGILYPTLSFQVSKIHNSQ